MGSSQLWGQAPSNLNINNPAEVIIALTEAINFVIHSYENPNDEYFLSLGANPQTLFEGLYELCLDLKPAVTSMSHSERVYWFGTITGMHMTIIYLYLDKKENG